MARHVDIEALKPEEGDPDFAAWEKAKKERKKRQRQMREYELQIAKNREESIKNITSFRSSKELSESEMNKFTEKLQETLSCVMDGSITQEFLDLMWKALNFETAVNEGRNQGEIRGRNIKIEEIKGKDQKTDGLPHLQSQGTVEKKKVDEVAKSIVTFQKNRRRFD